MGNPVRIETRADAIHDLAVQHRAIGGDEDAFARKRFQNVRNLLMRADTGMNSRWGEEGLDRHRGVRPLLGRSDNCPTYGHLSDFTVARGSPSGNCSSRRR
jgi:hypothetical protein